MNNLLRLLSLLALFVLSVNANAQWTTFTIFSNTSAVYYTPFIFSGTSTMQPIIGTTVRPAGVTTQWLSFDMQSNNYFTYTGNSGSGPHIAVGLRANATCAPSGNSANCSTNGTGVGVIFGNVSAAYNANTGQVIGCQDAPRAQIENYTGVVVPHLFTSTCSAKLSDQRWYHVDIHAHDNGAVAYWITDKSTNVVTSAGVNAGTDHSPNVSASTGYFFAGVEGLTQTWAVNFANVASGWF